MFLTFNSHLIARLQALTSTWWCCTAAVQIACCVHCLFWVWSIVSPSPWESTLGSLPQSCFPIIELVRCCLLWVLLLRDFTFLAIYQTLPFFSFFQKVPFDMDFIWKMKMKSSFFIWNIKKTCAARGSLRSSPHPSHPPPTNPTQKFDISMFLYQKQKGGSFK